MKPILGKLEKEGKYDGYDIGEIAQTFNEFPEGVILTTEEIKKAMEEEDGK